MVSAFADYLVGYGQSAEFGCFGSGGRGQFRRRDRVVVRGPNGLEIGTVLCRATEGHGRFLSRTARGEILRLADAADEARAHDALRRGRTLFEDGRRLAAGLGLPLEILDVEVLLEGRRVLVHYVKQGACDEGPFVSSFSRKHDLLVTMCDLGPPAVPAGGCDRPGCGGGGGGCSTCGSAGCGTCAGGSGKEDVSAYLLELRRGMEAMRGRRSLL